MLVRPAEGAGTLTLSQAYIYAVTLAFMARGTQGNNWYRLFKFSQGVPDELEIEAVAVVTADQFPRFSPQRGASTLQPCVKSHPHLCGPLHIA